MIGALLGHKKASTTLRYAHLANDSLKVATTEIGDKIREAMEKRPG
jgi:site-specific recombinase XerD